MILTQTQLDANQIRWATREMHCLAAFDGNQIKMHQTAVSRAQKNCVCLIRQEQIPSPIWSCFIESIYHIVKL